MRRAVPLPATLLAVAALAAGCAARPDPAPTATSSTTAAVVPSSVTPVVVPSAIRGELTRSTFGTGDLRQPVGRVPPDGASGRTGEALGVDAACSGPDGSTMDWVLESGTGTPLGLSGEADCSGPPVTSWLGVADRLPAGVRVSLVPASGVVSGYAVVYLGTP